MPQDVAVHASPDVNDFIFQIVMRSLIAAMLFADAISNRYRISTGRLRGAPLGVARIKGRSIFAGGSRRAGCPCLYLAAHRDALLALDCDQFRHPPDDIVFQFMEFSVRQHYFP